MSPTDETVATPIEAETLMSGQALRMGGGRIGSGSAGAAAARPVFIAPQTVDRVAFDELTRALGERIAHAEGMMHTLKQVAEEAQNCRAATREDIAKQKGYINLVSRLLRAVDQRTKELDSLVDHCLGDAGQRVADRMVELEASLGLRASDLDAALNKAIDEAVSKVHASVGAKQAELETQAAKLSEALAASEQGHAELVEQRVASVTERAAQTLEVRASEVSESIQWASNAATRSLQTKTSEAVESITLLSDQCDAAMRATLDSLKDELRSSIAEGQAMIHASAQACVPSVDDLVEAAKEKLAQVIQSIDQRAQQAIAEVQSQHSTRVAQLHGLAGASSSQVTQTADRAMQALNASAQEHAASLGQAVQAKIKAEHEALVLTIDERLNQFETLVAARRSELAEWTARLDVPQRLLQKLEQRVAALGAGLIDRFEGAIEARAQVLIAQAEQQLSERAEAASQSLALLITTRVADAEPSQSLGAAASEAYEATAASTCAPDPQETGTLVAARVVDGLEDELGDEPEDGLADGLTQAAADPVLDAIERLRGSVLKDLETLTQAMHAARSNAADSNASLEIQTPPKQKEAA